MPAYIDLLRDPRWQRKRLEIMSRDRWACVFCGDAESPLNVHHDYYERGFRLWEYPDHSLITLCEACHELTHNTDCPKIELKAMLIARWFAGTLTLRGGDYLFAKHGLAPL